MGTPGAVRDADCPVVTPDFNPRNFMPQASNDPATGQRAPLGRERAASSIPIGAHQYLLPKSLINAGQLQKVLPAPTWRLELV